ncbi:MAG: V-type ATP synthase subunit D [Chloroflexota bacterium]
MPRTRVPLTRSTLLQTQRTLAFARQGYELLDRKREILLAELMAATPIAERAREQLEQAFAEAYEALARARMSLGVDPVRRAALAAPAERELRVTERSIVGAVVPEVACPPVDLRPHYGFAGTSAGLDRAARSFAGLAATVCSSAQAETSVVRLALEVRKTQRRVNALRNVVIPTQEAIIKEVREALEDAEREAFFRAKRIRGRRERQAA